MIRLSIQVCSLVWCSRWFWHMSKLLVVVWLIVARTVSRALGLLSRVVRVHGFINLLIAWRHSFFQKLKTASRLLDILTAVVCGDHAISLRSWVSIIALRAKSTLVTWLIVVARVHVLLVYASIILIWIVTAVVTYSYAIVLNRVQCWLLTITILLSDAQASTNLIVGGFSLAIVWSLMTYLIVGIVVVLCFRNLSVSDTRVACWPKELINNWNWITLARICVPMAVSADKLAVAIELD